MRLTLRLSALVLLIIIATLTDSSSTVSYCSPCEDGCARGYEFCMGQSTPPNQGKCATEADACMKKCKGITPVAEVEN
jgi:hypothetical protein